MRALSIRQPYAELILRGIKTVEYRSRGTSIIGERFLIYASKKKPACDELSSSLTSTSSVESSLRAEGSRVGAGLRRAQSSRSQNIWSTDLSNTGETPVPPWMMELAEQVALIPPGTQLPRGLIVGSAIIEKVQRVSSQLTVGSKRNADAPLTTDNGQLTTVYAWHLTGIERFASPRQPSGHPQPMWWRPRGV